MYANLKQDDNNQHSRDIMWINSFIFSLCLIDSAFIVKMLKKLQVPAINLWIWNLEKDYKSKYVATVT